MMLKIYKSIFKYFKNLFQYLNPIWVIIIVISIIYSFEKNNILVFTIVISSVNLYLSVKSTRDSMEIQRKTLELSISHTISDQAKKIYVHTISDSSLNISNERHDAIYLPVLIGNSSDEPVYKVYVVSAYSKASYPNYFFGNINTKFIYIPTLIKGNIYKIIGTDGSGMGSVPSCIICFVDSRGVRWLRDTQGSLHKLSDDFNPLKYFNIDVPRTFDMYSYKTYKNLDSIYSKYNYKDR